MAQTLAQKLVARAAGRAQVTPGNGLAQSFALGLVARAQVARLAG